MRKTMTLLFCLFLLPTIPWTSAPASGGKVVLGQFKDGSATDTLVFAAPGSNSSAQLELPKTATIVRASADITGRPCLQNISITADTMEDFASCTLSNMDINTSAGELQLPKDPSWNDEFNGSALDQRWMWFNTPYAYDLGDSRPGYLHIVSQRMTNFGAGADSGILVYQNVSGGFSIETKIISTPQSDYEKSGIMVRQDSDNWVALKYQSENGAKVEWTTKIGGSATDTMVSASASPMYLRLERNGNSFSCHYSTDGSAWTELSGGPWTVSLTDAVWAGLIVADGSADSNYAADYDYFRLDKYCGNGSLLSGWTEAPGNVTQATATCSGVLNPMNSSFLLSVRTGPANPWQALPPGVTTQLTPSGANISYKIEMTSEGFYTPDLYDLRINFSVPMFPSDISLGLGMGAPFWTLSGELNTTRTIDLKEPLAAFLVGTSPGPGGKVTIPLSLSSGTPGTLLLQNLTIEYLIGVPPAAPTLRLPAPGAYIASLPPILSLNASDADGDPFLFSVELSDDGFRTITSYNQNSSGAGWSKGNRTYLPGEEANLRPTYPLVDGRAYSWRARAFDGAYWSAYSEVRSFTVDTTPPLGVPRGEGNYTSIPDSLAAVLDFGDNESGVESYEYMIGTSQGAWDVAANATTSNASVRVNGLSLSMGSKYYFTARARNRAGLWSDWASSDGIMYWPAGMESAGIRIEQPVAGSNLSGVFAISGASWLRDGWTRNHTVQVRIDDGLWKNATFISAPPSYARNWTLKWDTLQASDGPHLVQARVAFGYGDGAEIVVTNVSVNVTNTLPQPPIPVLAADFQPGDNVTLSIPENSTLEFSIHTDAQGLIIAWMVDGAKRPVDVSSKFIFRTGYSSAGVHNISVSVQSGKQALQHNWTVNVTNVDRSPVAAILMPLPGSGWKTSEAITFNASTSRDPDPEDLLSFTWVLGDGTVLNGSEVSHGYKEPGNYEVLLTVSDGLLESRAYLNLTISAPEKTIQAGAGYNFSLGLLAVVLMAAVASGGGYWYLKRRRAGTTERERAREAENVLMAERPVAAAWDEAGEASNPTREDFPEEGKRTAGEPPEAAPLYSARAADSTAVTDEISFEEILGAEAVPLVGVKEAEPAPRATPQIMRPPPRAPVATPTSPPPARPMMSRVPRVPAPVTRPARPAAPAQPTKKAETLEEILAILEGK